LERKAFDSCGKEEREVGDPTGEAEEAPIPPRGKQVPAAERNGPLPTNNKLYENNLYFLIRYLKCLITAFTLISEVYLTLFVFDSNQQGETKSRKNYYKMKLITTVTRT
jgi:hypothetical protein